MTTFSKGFLAAACVAAALGMSGAAWSQDAETAVKNRQDAMKAQGKDLGAVKAFVEGKGELAAAQQGGADLAKRIAVVPTLFPKDTGMDKLPGKSWAKPVVWSEPDKFAAAAKTAAEKANALDAALKTSDKDKIKAAFGDMGKNGCGGCHETFREKKPS